MSQDTETRPTAAALCMTMATLLIGGVDTLIIILSEQIGLWQFHFVRALFAAPLVMFLPLLGLGTLRPRRIWAIAVRSGLVGLSMLLYFSALALMPIAQALAGLFTSPIFILLISWIFFRQRVGFVRISSVIIGFIGILMVLQLKTDNLTGLTFLPIAAGFFYALGALATRTICAGESTVALLAGMWVMLWIMGAVGLVVLAVFPIEAAEGSAGFATRGWIWPIWSSLKWLIMQAWLSVIAVFLIIKAYQLGEASHVSIFEYSVMVFGPLYALFLFDQTLVFPQVAGIGLVITAGVVVALRSRPT